MSLLFEVPVERARYRARKPLIERAWNLRIELAPGIVFQPETAKSVEDQVVETLWAEGKTLESIDAAEEAEVRASFSALSPRREAGGRSIAASLLLGFPEEERRSTLERLKGFPDQLQLELGSGLLLQPVVDRGAASATDRLPTVLALRFCIPDGDIPVALRSAHPAHPGRFVPVGTWAGWIQDAPASQTR